MNRSQQYRCPETGTLFNHRLGTTVYHVRNLFYPQIDSIPILKTRAGAGEELEAHLASVLRGGRKAVLDWLAACSAQNGYSFNALRRVIEPESSSPFMRDWAEYCGTQDHYFLIRWACPSYLSNLAFLDHMAGKRIACLASGIGHFPCLLKTIRPHSEVTIVDGNLIHLLVAKTYMAPSARAICADLDDSLPLPDASFNLVMMNDAFHYIDDQSSLLREIKRILKPDGHAILLHIHDPRNLHGESVPGKPVSPTKFANMARAAGWHDLKFYSEISLVQNLALGKSTYAAVIENPSNVPPGPYAVCLYKERKQAINTWNNSLGHDQMILNPIYTEISPGRYKIDWRGSKRNRREFGHTPLPSELTTEDLASNVQTLFKRGILIPNPDTYVSV